MIIDKKFFLLVIVLLSIIIYVSLIDIYKEESERIPNPKNITLDESEGILNINNLTLNESDEVPNDEYEVYSAVLLQRNYSKSIKKIVIQQMTANKTLGEDTLFGGDVWNSSIQNFENYNGEKLDVVLVDDFKKKNSLTHMLNNNFSVPQSVVLISKKELNEIFNEKGWDSFYEKYPDSPGYIGLSRVGFNRNHTQAILYFSNVYAGLGGEGDLIFLVKEEGNWIVKDQVMLWIS